MRKCTDAEFRLKPETTEFRLKPETTEFRLKPETTTGLVSYRVRQKPLV